MNNGTVKASYRVLYGDVDSMGIIYYGNYFRLFELGRTEFIRPAACPTTGRGKRRLMPVTEVIVLLPTAKYDDLLLVETRVGEVRRASIRFDYEIFRDATKMRDWSPVILYTPASNPIESDPRPGFLAAGPQGRLTFRAFPLGEPGYALWGNNLVSAEPRTGISSRDRRGRACDPPA